LSERSSGDMLARFLVSSRSMISLIMEAWPKSERT
jgi:hypothetical protein